MKQLENVETILKLIIDINISAKYQPHGILLFIIIYLFVYLLSLEFIFAFRQIS